MTVLRPALATSVALAVCSPAAARPYKLDIPAGRLADAITALGRQTRASIAVDDPALWERRVLGLRATVSVQTALRRLLAGTSVEVLAVGPDVFRVRSVRPVRRAKPPSAAPLPTPPPPPVDAPDIVVTASKRDLRLRDFAGSASIIAGRDINFGGASGTDAVLSKLATVSSTYLGAGRNKLFIRGIADSSFTGPTQATVGQYLGDVRLSYNAPDPDLRLYDIQSVEVLEGPQGTLYGAGSLGGIIRTIPNEPAQGTVAGTLIAGASATEHGALGADLAGTLNLPVIGDSVALRLVGYSVSDGGYIDNPLRHRDDVNRTSITGGRASLRVAASDGWSVDLGGALQHTASDDSQYSDADGPRLTRNSPVAEGFDATYSLGQVVVAKETGSVRFRATLAAIGQKLEERYDATAPGGAARIFRQGNDTNMVTGEARLWRPLDVRSGWIIGVSYLHSATLLQRALGSVDAPLPVTGVDNRVTEVTVYGEGSYRLAPWLTATAGGRISHTRLSGTAVDQRPAASFADALLRAAITADRESTSYLPSVALVATPLPETSIYARYQEGFRPGGLAVDSDFVRRFDGDRVATTEAGLRYISVGRMKVDVSLVASHTVWRNIQADFLDSAGLPTTDNIGNGRIWSVAASAGWRPVAGLRLEAAFALNDGRVTEPSAAYRVLLSLAKGTSAAGIDRIPNVARFTTRVGADWQHALTDRLSLHVGAWGRYVGRSRIGVGPVLGAQQGDYPESALTARVGSPVVGVTLGVTNLTDSLGNRFALGTPFATGRPQITPLRPRTIRLGVDFSF